MAIPPQPFNPSFQACATATLVSAPVLAPLCIAGVATVCPPLAIAGAALWGVSKLVSRAITGGDVLRPALFLEPGRNGKYKELFSTTMIQGGTLTKILPLYLKVLGSENSPNAKMGQSVLQSLLNFESCFNHLRIGNSKLLQDFLQSIWQLEPGQKTALSLSWESLSESGHALIASIEKEPEGKFTVRIHNGGLGVENHPARSFYNGNGVTTGNQTTLEFCAVDSKNLEAFIWHIASLRGLHLIETNSAIYDALILLGGERSERAYSIKSQSGGNCSGYSVRCLLETILSPTEFESFEYALIQEGISGLEKGFKEGSFWDRTVEHYAGHRALREARGEWVEEELPTPSCLSRSVSAVNRFALTGYSEGLLSLNQSVSWQEFCRVSRLPIEDLPADLLVEPSAFDYLLARFKTIPDEKKQTVFHRIRVEEPLIPKLARALDAQPEIFHYLPGELRHNEELVSATIVRDKKILAQLPDNFLLQPDIFAAISGHYTFDADPDVYQYILKVVRDRPDKLAYAIAHSKEFIKVVPEEMFEEALVEMALEAHGSECMKDIPKKFITTKERAEHLVRSSFLGYLSLPEPFQQDKGMILFALKQFRNAHKAVKGIVDTLSDEQLLDPDILEAAMKHLPSLHYVPKIEESNLRVIRLIQHNLGLLSLVVTKNPEILQFFPEDLLSDIGVIRLIRNLAADGKIPEDDYFYENWCKTNERLI